jgi:MoxR-like ATPase
MSTETPQAAAPVPTLGTAEASTIVAAILEQIGGAFYGQQQVLDELLVALMAGGHVLLEGVPGLGKTLLVRALSAATSFNKAVIPA